jgi:hypothetical protein
MSATGALPRRAGLKTDSYLSKRDAALAAWAEVAEKITVDASAAFPT